MNYSDQNIIEGIRAGGVRRERCVNYLIDTHIGFMHKLLIKKARLSKEQARDAYYDAITKVVHKIETGEFRATSKISSYLYKAINHMGIDLNRKAPPKKTEEIPLLYQVADTAFQRFFNQDEVKFYLQQIGETCRMILTDWSQGYPMEEIAIRIGFKNANSVKAKRYQCLERLIKNIQKYQHE